MSNTIIGAAPAVSSLAKAAQRTLSNPAIFGILLLLGCAYAFNGIDRSIFPALLGPIGKEYGLTLASGGFLANAFTGNVAIFAALSSWFITRFGRKTTLAGGLIAYSIFTILTPLSTNFTELAFNRAMTGAGEGLQISAIYSMIGAYFGSRRGTFLGINNSFFGVGTFVGPVLGTHLFVWFSSWHLAFYVFGIAGIVAALGVFLFVPASFSEAMDNEEPDVTRKVQTPGHFVNRNSLLCVLALFLMGYSFFAYTALYSTYLRTELGFSITQAGTAFGMYGIGTLCGFFGGWLGDRLKRYGLIGALAILAIVGYVLFHGVASLPAHMALSFLFGAMVSGFLYPRIVTVLQRSVQPHHVDRATSMLIPVFFVAGFISGPVFGKSIPILGWHLASTLSVVLPAGVACLISCFVHPQRMRGN